MKIVSTNVFVGPNVWAGFPVIRHVVDLGVLEDWPSARIGDGWIDALVEALPGLRVAASTWSWRNTRCARCVSSAQTSTVSSEWSGVMNGTTSSTITASPYFVP